MIKEANNIIEFKSNIEDVWNIITNREDISWRPDILKVEFINDEEFKEITKSGQTTSYKIEKNEKYSIYRLNMKNNNIEGIFQASFKDNKKKGCTVEFYQKNELLNIGAIIASILFVNLNKLQNRYIYDIKKMLGEL